MSDSPQPAVPAPPSTIARRARVATAQRQQHYPEDVVVALNRIEKALGGRQQLVGALSLAEQTKPLRRLLGVVDDPDYRLESLATLCEAADVLPGDLMTAVTAGLSRAAHVEALKLVADQTPAIVADIVRRAQPHEERCDDCDGTGMLPPDEPTTAKPNPQPTPCKACKGRGIRRYRADAACRDLAVDMAGLTPKTGGISIVNQLGVAGAGGAVGLSASFRGGASIGFERMQEAADRILFAVEAPARGVEEPAVGEPVAPVVEAELAEGPRQAPSATDESALPSPAAPSPAAAAEIAGSAPTTWAPPPGRRPVPREASDGDTGSSEL